MGMEILWGLKKDDGQWDGGQILDPEKGKVYGAKLSLADDGQKLNVRGFVGFSLLGRTQTWIRETDPAGVTPSTTAPSTITGRSEEHTSEFQSPRRSPYSVFCSKKTKY